ncbi:hypothetical protein IV203_010635 [Nitzschia inconspicua]|uniref:Uncharacterized protein n=1 Tax=Nitzschia inconspicua TaxID=303405 RepID=A0A9K3KWI2_9STRA|nr:hypothetical protein IV203_010635 [Nitzschia inconspicua]
MKFISLFCSLGGVGALSGWDSLKTVHAAGNRKNPSTLEYQPDACHGEKFADLRKGLSEQSSGLPYLSVSSKLLCVEDCSLDLFIRMMDASYSFHDHSCTPMVLPSDPPARPSPNDDAWILHMFSSSVKKDNQSSLESLLVHMPLSTFSCVELLSVEAWIHPDLYQEMTIDAMSHICLTQYSLALKLAMVSQERINKSGTNPNRGYPARSPNLASTQEIVILEDMTNLNRSFGCAKKGVLIHGSVCRLVDDSETGRALQETAGNGVFLHYDGAIRSGTVLWYKANLGKGRIQPDDDVCAESLCFHGHNMDRSAMYTANQSISFRVVWKSNPDSGGMERLAELIGH